MMNVAVQRFMTPEGTEMVVLPAKDFDRLAALAAEGEDVADARAALARIDAGEGTMPGEVLGAILDDGLHPIAAWRRYRGLSQAELARRTGLSQVWLSRIESGGGTGSAATRRKLAEALEAPVWALEEEGDLQEDVMQHSASSSGKGAKYAPLLEYLRKKDDSQVTMRYDEISKLVGGLPKSASLHRAWWSNHEGNSQAQGWMPARYLAEPDMSRRSVVFRRFTY
jgi:transcriptional regulator with XRE-family HTH domain